MGSSKADMLPGLVKELGAGARRQRQAAAQTIFVVAQEDPSSIVPYMDELIDALGRPEAQTRWEVLDTLTIVAASYPETIANALEEAEASLFDEDSAPVRLAAFRLIAAYATTSAERAEKVWPLLDEAIQCYHGDAEYRDMLVSLLALAQSALSESTASALQDRMAFDAQSGTGYIQVFSDNIVKELEGKVQ